MIKYLELKHLSGSLILIKVDSIKEVSKDSNHNTVYINGSKYNHTYEEIKALLMNEERRVCYSIELEPKTRALMRNATWQLVKDLGEKKAILMIQDLLKC